MTDAVAYLRVSGPGQLRGFGLERQEAKIRAYAAANDLRLVKVYKEPITGTNDLGARPGLSALVRERRASVFLVEKLDRLARDQYVQETIIRDVKKQGWDVVSVEEPDLCKNDPSRIMMRQIFGAIAQYEKSMLVAKLWDGRQRKRAKGERGEGRLAYGEDVNRPHERQIVELIVEWRKDGSSWQQIADRLNASGFQAKGKQFYPATARRICRRARLESL